MEALKGSVLLLCANFFDYDKRICKAIQSAGYAVDLVEEKPSCSFIAKSCIRYNVKAYRPIIRKYIRSVILENKDKRYDYVVVVKGEAINEEALRMLRAAYPNARFILYLWDSVANIPDCESRMKLYDKVVTFDPVDAEKYRIPILSIPYDDEFEECSNSSKCVYDVAFVGTAHSSRPRIVKQIQELCNENGRKCFVYLYSPHILVYLLNKLTNASYRAIKISDVHFKPLSSQELLEVYSKSKCILDIEHPKQRGTTTRPVEMLPIKKKIITTNHNIKNYPFYNENNFYIIDRDDPNIDTSFFDTEYASVDEKLLEKYSPQNFALQLLREQN